MKALLIVAHGSRRAESNQEVQALTKSVAQKAGTSFDLVDCAFLELADVLIPDGVNSLIEKGAKSIHVVPYFLAKGAHVASDIPEAIMEARTAHPGVEISVSNYFGACDAVPDMLLELALASE